LIALAIVLPFITPIYAPQLLAFPYRSSTAAGTVWSVDPLEPAMLAAAAKTARERLATSPLADTDERRPIFVTDGGWRWLWLAPASQGSFAISRPLTKAVVINRTDPATGIISNGAAVGGRRRLGTVLAHEFAHGLIRRHFGVFAAQGFSAWKTEGYCDHVAGESSLNDAQAAALERSGANHPALVYYHGRKGVAAFLASHSGDVDALFRGDD
jgi:hypothetical protein